MSTFQRCCQIWFTSPVLWCLHLRSGLQRCCEASAPGLPEVGVAPRFVATGILLPQKAGHRSPLLGTREEREKGALPVSLSVLRRLHRLKSRQWSRKGSPEGPRSRNCWKFVGVTLLMASHGLNVVRLRVLWWKWISDWYFSVFFNDVNVFWTILTCCTTFNRNFQRRQARPLGGCWHFDL